MAEFVAKLREELLRACDAGLTPRIWWRDDDLVGQSDNLERLHALGQESHARCLTAVIPALCEDDLPRTIEGMSSLIICQHGYRHQNHDVSDGPKSEFGPGRPVSAVHEEVSRAFSRMLRLFGPRFAPIFVPPWNRCARQFGPTLVEIGFVGFSGFAAEQIRPSHPKLPSVDVHVDVVRWSAKPQMLPLNSIGAQLVAAFMDERLRAEERLAARKRYAEGRQDIGNLMAPVGLLTHHRVFNEEAWELLHHLFALLKDMDEIGWAEPMELFDLGAPIP